MSWWKRDSAVPATRRAPMPSGEVPVRRGSILDRLEVEQLFRECCERSTPVVLLCSEHEELAYQGRFAALENDQITVDLLIDRDRSRAVDAVMPPKSVCAVAFTHDERSYVFLAHVASFRAMQKSPANLPKVILTLPALIAATETRMSFRIPVISSTQKRIAVQIHLEDKVATAIPLDLSATGMLFEITDPQFKLNEEQRIGVSMTLDKISLQLTAVVIPRRQPNLYGAYFPDVLRGAQIVPPAALRDLLAELEREWLISTVAE